MTIFDDREKAFESKFRLDQEVAFKIGARRDRLLGLWAAERMGLAGDDAAAYARSVVEADFEKTAGDHPALTKVLRDLEAHGQRVSEAELHRHLDHLAEVAREQITAELKG